METHMQCPVCSRQAENLTPSTLEGVVVGCDHCGQYRIAGSALHDLMRLHIEKRGAALKAAKLASRHGWPMINVATLALADTRHAVSAREIASRH
jgi:hypothetical protein